MVGVLCIQKTESRNTSKVSLAPQTHSNHSTTAPLAEQDKQLREEDNHLVEEKENIKDSRILLLEHLNDSWIFQRSLSDSFWHVAELCVKL